MHCSSSASTSVKWPVQIFGYNSKWMQTENTHTDKIINDNGYHNKNTQQWMIAENKTKRQNKKSRRKTIHWQRSKIIRSNFYVHHLCTAWSRTFLLCVKLGNFTLYFGQNKIYNYSFCHNHKRIRKIRTCNLCSVIFTAVHSIKMKSAQNACGVKEHSSLQQKARKIQRGNIHTRAMPLENVKEGEEAEKGEN